MPSAIDLGGSTPQQRKADYLAALNLELLGYRTRGETDRVQDVQVELRAAERRPLSSF